MFDQYQKSASQTFKEHDPLDELKARYVDWTLGLVGETGEVVEKVKHFLFSHEKFDKVELAKELGDILWYLSAIATTADIRLSDIAALNQAKLAHRYANGSYTDEQSAVRHEAEKAFKDTFAYQCISARILGIPAPLNIIVVGPDGSGKTTLCKMLTEALEGFDYVKCDYRQDDKPNLCHKLLGERVNRVFDRFYYPDDIIYSRIQWQKEHPEDPIDWDDPYWKSYNSVLRALQEYNTVWFFVTADTDVLTQRSKAWADDYISVEDLDEIKSLYSRWLRFIAARPGCVFVVDTTNGTPEEHLAHMVGCVHRAQAYFSGLEDIDAFCTPEEKERFAELDRAAETLKVELAEDPDNNFGEDS